ncbi:hypothetical protein FXO37_36572 [Capsicum annuum]|nr:hypothetical protein FXO37_36572 [Capsicum annuum]
MLLFEILTMPQLRHLRLDWNYLRSHEPTEKSLVLKNLQCFSGLNPRYCTGSFFRLFPNLKKLGVRGVPEDFSSCKDMYDFSSLGQIKQLEFLLNAQNIFAFWRALHLRVLLHNIVCGFRRKSGHILQMMFHFCSYLRQMLFHKTLRV